MINITCSHRLPCLDQAARRSQQAGGLRLCRAPEALRCAWPRCSSALRSSPPLEAPLPGTPKKREVDDNQMDFDSSLLSILKSVSVDFRVKKSVSKSIYVLNSRHLRGLEVAQSAAELVAEPFFRGTQSLLL